MKSRTDEMPAGNSRAAYMREYRKSKRLEEDNRPKRTSYMPKGSVNIEKHIKTYLLNTCVFNAFSFRLCGRQL
jgi:hypothetical protein